ncbi:hypothetical protein ACTXLR_09610 [Psychrobacter faecalis]|uniref:hypothetical protein n=1 Tax=Psychrobacter faecalis TaxID=180588 RepID=UPI003FD33157
MNVLSYNPDENVKKIIIISHSSYPDTSPRSMRTDELAQELARKGYNITLYILTGGYDYSSYEKMHNVTVNSLGKTFFFKFSYREIKAQKIFTKVVRKILNKVFEFPYIELSFKTYKAIKKEDSADLLITIGQPYPIHWGAALFRTINKKKMKKTIWVADCGDPYMGNAFSKKFFYFKYIEKWFCKKADFISIPTIEAKQGYYSDFHEKIKVIPQGFNFNDVEISKNNKPNSVVTFIYAGNFYSGIRDPRPFLDYLASLDIEFKFIIYTKSHNILKGYEHKLGDKLSVRNYISRKQLVLEMSMADFLVNLENPSPVQTPSKLIDYGLSNRPILNVNTNKELNKNMINSFLKRDYKHSFKIDNIQQYNIVNVADSFLSLLNKV